MSKYSGSYRYNSHSLNNPPELDSGFLIGFGLIAAIFILVAIFGGNASGFFSPLSLLLVLGGTVAAVLVQFSVEDLFATIGVLREALQVREERVGDRVQRMLDLATRVRSEGILVLDQESSETTDAFLQLGLEMTVDGQSAEQISRVLEREIFSSDEQGSKAAVVLESMGSYAPALGLIGTVLGLIQMLGQLTNPSALGPSLSLALIATLYGAVLSNLFFFPLAGKVRLGLGEARQIKLVTLEALVSLSKQESSVILEQRLQGFRALVANQ